MSMKQAGGNRKPGGGGSGPAAASGAGGGGGAGGRQNLGRSVLSQAPRREWSVPTRVDMTRTYRYPSRSEESGCAA